VLRLLSLILCGVILYLAHLVDARSLTPLAEQSSAPRSIVVIGDLHMGPGRQGAGWHPYEDFRWRDEFVRFLDALDAESGDTDLVINGDLFELLQSTAVPCTYDDPGLGCTEDEARQRLETVIAAHADELLAIGRFAAAGSNRVHVVPGDHDAALLMPPVWRRAVASFAAPADRVTLAASGRWVSPDGRVHVEHGHQLPLSADRFSSWPDPVVTIGGRSHVERPWGEQVILPFYDRWEARYPIVDNVAEEGVGAKFVAADLDADRLEGAPSLLRFLLTKTTWQQFRMDLDGGDVQAPAWDVEQIRSDLATFVARSLPSDDPFAGVVKEMTAEHLSAAGQMLSDQQIIAVCDYRAAIRRARRRMERVLTQLAGSGPPTAECPRLPHTVGPAFEHYWRSRDQQVAQHIGGTEGLDVIVFGHTHLLDRPFRPFGDEGPVVVTSGAWQRTVHPLQITQLDAQPESLPPCYTFIRLPASRGTRTAEARSWQLNEQQQWTMGSGC
jgi:UDP-2,3-diacylglucosamine pyrophosphatase LpxH